MKKRSLSLQDRISLSDQVFSRLETLYPDPRPFLDHSDAFTLLVAVILSAQCTDAMVNKVTPSLFPEFNTPQKMLELGEEQLATRIRRCGYYNAKAKNIIKLCGELIATHHGLVPDTMEDLVALSGVGRKTASVVLSQWFDVPAVPVDTHVHRVSNRIGLVDTKTPDATEFALREVVDKEHWILGHMRMILLGRSFCIARKPKCEVCPLNDICQKRLL